MAISLIKEFKQKQKISLTPLLKNRLIYFNYLDMN